MTRKTASSRRILGNHVAERLGFGALLAFLLLAAVTPVFAADNAAYGYFRTLDGTAGVIPNGETQAAEIAVNQPVLTGDRIIVDPGSRLEIVLPDGSRVRLDGGTDLTLTALADSGDQESSTTQLTLNSGLIQLVVPEGLGAEDTRIDTGNATAYVREPGTYRFEARGVRFTEVVAREGSLEVLTRRGSSLVRQNDAIRIEGDDWPTETLADAGPEVFIERWGDELEADITRASMPASIDDGLGYAAAPLDDYGDWMDVDGRSAWRPRVTAGWSPYSDGRWTYTPSGLTWVSYEPWGWMPYHYGTWDFVPYYGWVWYPGNVYAPAWVYWYWGPSYVGWCPTGFYTQFYGPRYARLGLGFRWGTYGWIGGDWGLYSHWNFVPTRDFADRDLRRRVHTGAWITREHGRPAFQRGLLTTDTRVISRADMRDPDQALQAITRRVSSTRPGVAADLPDATAFVARRENLGNTLERAVLTRDTGQRLIAPPGRVVATRAEGRRASSVSSYDSPGVQVPSGERFDAVDVTGGSSRPVTSTRSTASSARGREAAVPRGGTVRGGGTYNLIKPPTPDRQPLAARPPVGRTDEALSPDVTLPSNRVQLARPLLDRPTLNRQLVEPRVSVPERNGQSVVGTDWRNRQSGNAGSRVRSVPVPGAANPGSQRVPVVRRVIDGLRSVAPVPGGSRVTGNSPLSSHQGSSLSASPRGVAPRSASPRPAPAPRSSSSTSSRSSGSHSSSNSSSRGRASSSRTPRHR